MSRLGWTVCRASLPLLLLIAGCSLFRDPRVRVAYILSISAPDTVRADTTFNFTVDAELGHHSDFKLDHADTDRGDSQFALRIWSRDISRKGYAVLWYCPDTNLTFEARPAEPGIYHIVAHQPDGSTKEKSITVLP
jgi:hypothetical protein